MTPSPARPAIKTSDLEALLSSAKSVCVLTGAGISQESGVPTFRGAGGLWKQYRPEELATPEAFARDPMTVWEWYAWRREIIGRAQPNAAHFALAELEQRFAGDRNGDPAGEQAEPFTLLTQNVDGLHERAGSRNVIRLHGDIWRLRCTQCGAERQDNSVPLDPFPPRCDCSSLMRPGVVWFGEPLPDAAWRRATMAASSAELFLIVGTSALVEPAASLPLLGKQNGARLVEINLDPTPLSGLAELSIRGKAAEVLGPLQEKIRRGKIGKIPTL
ncbi:MAG: NAD-dependent deacylase [Acidobacteria bacterium]|nr:NAD-dependent deacylase [Acidobacteriota bacterium]